MGWGKLSANKDGLRVAKVNSQPEVESEVKVWASLPTAPSQPASRQRSLERERRFSSGSSSGGVAGLCSDRARQDRTMAFVNGECGEGAGQGETLHKCPSAPCIPSQQGRGEGEVVSVSYCDETNTTNTATALTDKW